MIYISALVYQRCHDELISQECCQRELIVNHSGEQRRSGARPAAPSQICIFRSLVRHGKFADGPDVGETAATELCLECMRVVRPRACSHVVYKAFGEGQTLLMAFPLSEHRLVQ